jgi:hypothetical protein
MPSSPLSSRPPPSSPPFWILDYNLEASGDNNVEEAGGSDWEDEGSDACSDAASNASSSGESSGRESSVSNKSVGSRSGSRAQSRERRGHIRLGRGLEHLTPSAQEYMRRIEAILHEARWDIGRFLMAYTRKGRQEVRVRSLQRALRKTRRLRQLVLEGLEGQALMKEAAERVRREWRDVIGTQYFGKEEPVTSIDELDPEAAFVVLKKRAPLWAELLQFLLQPRRNRSKHNKSKQPADEEFVAGDAVMQRSICITIVSLSMFARNSSSGFRTKLGCYLCQSGLAKRAIDVLSSFGLTPTYKYINRSINRMVERAEVSLNLGHLSVTALNIFSLDYHC